MDSKLPPYEYHRAKRLKTNPVKIEDIDALIIAIKNDLKETDATWYYKLARFCTTFFQIIAFWIFIIIRKKLLDDEIEVMKQEYEINRTSQAQRDVNNTFKF